MRRRRTRWESWRAYALFVSMPLWWLLGLSHFIWFAIGFGMLLSLLLRPERTRVPRGFGVWLLFLGWMLASSLELDTTNRAFGFAFRFALYGAATVLCLYLYNAPTTRIKTTAIINALAIYWVIVVAGGYIAMVFPHLSYVTPAAHLLPGSLAGNAYVHDLVTARFADVQTFLGYPIGRPETFFTYTNGWGSGFAILAPFAFAALEQTRSRRWKRGLQVALVASVVPAIVSLNRGLWLSLGVALIYVALRYIHRRDVRGFARIAICGVLAAAVVVTTSLSGLIGQRFAHQHSNAARKALYAETFSRAEKSPIVGYGAPRPAQSGGYLDSAGTQGQVLYLVFSHGFPGAVLFLGWLGIVFVMSRRNKSPAASWAHVAILVTLVQAPFYGITLQMIIVMAAAAVIFRELDARAAVPETTERKVANRVTDEVAWAR